MKKLLLVSITALSVSSLTSFVAPKAYATDVAQTLCEYIAVDDKNRMRSFLKTNKLKIRNVFDGIQCNGMNLLEFAASRGAVETGSLIIGQLPKNTVSENLALLNASQPLVAEANNRINS